MFSKHSESPVSFNSNWKTEQSLASSAAQTDDVIQKEAECQVVELVEAGMQTEEEESPKYDQPEYDKPSLLTFLQRITPKVIQELERQSRSRAFDGFSMLKEEELSGVKLMHTLRWNQLHSEGVVACLDWSCTGSVIGVGYSSRYHDDWCDHKGAIAVWNINRSDFDANQPERVIEVSSCVTSLAFHPSNPAIFAAGTYSGELLIYDLSRVDDVSSLTSGECGGSVTSISWVDSLPVNTPQSRTPNVLVTTTNSGFVLVWGLHLAREQLPLKSGYMLQGQDVPRDIRMRIDDAAGVGITTASFNSEDSMLFVLGAEGGGLFLCSTASEAPTGVEYNGIGLMRCVTSALSPHMGRVVAAQCSPHHRNAILTAASDNQLRLYTLLQPNKPVSVIYSEESVMCAQWSPSRPLVVASGLVTGEVDFYEFGPKSCRKFLTLDAAEKPSPITTLKFNDKNMNLLGVGDQLGRVAVWQLPNSAVSPLSTEISSLHALLDIRNE